MLSLEIYVGRLLELLETQFADISQRDAQMYNLLLEMKALLENPADITVDIPPIEIPPVEVIIPPINIPPIEIPPIDVETFDPTFHPIGSHMSIQNLNGVLTLEGRGCTRIMACATQRNLRFTLDGSLPISNRGFVLSPSTTPMILYTNAIIKITKEASAAAGLEYQWGT